MSKATEFTGTEQETKKFCTLVINLAGNFKLNFMLLN